MAKDLTRAAQEAIELSKRFHGFDPRAIHDVDIDWPKSLTLLGACARVHYVCRKFDNRLREYFHDFDQPCVLYAPPRLQKDGTNLLIIHGGFRITKAGIVG